MDVKKGIFISYFIILLLYVIHVQYKENITKVNAI